jgi:ribosome-associated protein
MQFHFTRSGGPGGQNVNKVSTRVELLFDVVHSPSLSESQKEKIIKALRPRIGTDGVFRIASQESRSQWRNREDVVEKFILLLQNALKPRKKRLPTRPSGAAREKRITAKKRHGQKKKSRGDVSLD